MENIKKSLNAIAKVANHEAVINEFARSKYFERFGGEEKRISCHSGYHAYDGYDVISETKLKVKYTYGGGDMDFKDFFYVEVE